MSESFTYHVHLDINDFKELFVAQQGQLQRVSGIILATISLLIIFLLVAIGSLADDLLFVVLLGLLAILGIAFAVHPVMLLSGRSEVVRSWFESHGARNATSASLDELVADYDVEITDYGFIERVGFSGRRVPWFALTGKSSAGQRATYFMVDNGKESSVLYNMVGVNWMFRDESVAGVLVVPNDVLAANPGLTDKIRANVSASRSRYRGVGGRKAIESDAGLRDWALGKTN